MLQGKSQPLWCEEEMSHMGRLFHNCQLWDSLTFLWSAGYCQWQDIGLDELLVWGYVVIPVFL